MDPNGHLHFLAKTEVGQFPVPKGGLREVFKNVVQFIAIACADAEAEALRCGVGKAGEFVGVEIL